MAAQAHTGGIDESTFPDVLARARARDGAAWAQLYRWLAPRIAGYLRAQGCREADDLTSETFLALVRGIDRFEGTAAKFTSFAFVIAHRRLQDARRRDAARAPLAPWAGVEPALHDELATNLAAQEVLAYCARLTEDQRDVVFLRVVADLDLDGTAAVLGRTRGAVKALQHRAFEQLRKELAREAVSR